MTTTGTDLWEGARVDLIITGVGLGFVTILLGCKMVVFATGVVVFFVIVELSNVEIVDAVVITAEEFCFVVTVDDGLTLLLCRELVTKGFEDVTVAETELFLVSDLLGVIDTLS